jgi:hypothetical protein
MKTTNASWTQKGATLSDKSARKEFGITQEEIVEAIQAGKLQYRQNAMHGNPYLRLLRAEVEQFVQEKYGDAYWERKQWHNELDKINLELKRCRTRMKKLKQQKDEVLHKIAGDAA